MSLLQAEIKPAISTGANKLSVFQHYLRSHPLASQRKQEGIGLRMCGIVLHQQQAQREQLSQSIISSYL